MAVVSEREILRIRTGVGVGVGVPRCSMSEKTSYLST